MITKLNMGRKNKVQQPDLPSHLKMTEAEFFSNILTFKPKYFRPISLFEYFGLTDPSAVQWHTSYAFMWEVHNSVVLTELVVTQLISLYLKFHNLSFFWYMLFYHYYKHAHEYIQVVNTSNKAIFLQSQFSEKKQLQGHITHV